MRAIRRILAMDGAEIRERSRQALALRLDRIGLGRRVRGFPAIDRLPVDLETFLARSDRFFAGVADLDATVAALRRLDPEDERRAIHAANAVLGGKVHVFGIDHDVGSPPDWTLEPVSGLHYPNEHWSQIDYLNPHVGGEYKTTWEIGRHQYFLDLGRAWLYSGDERYPEAFASHVRDFIRVNPPGQGIHWSSSLEVAFRAHSWIWALHLFRSAPVMTPELFAEMVSALVMHARHIDCYLSTYFSPNTHLTGESLALYWIGAAFPELDESGAWRANSCKVLEQQLPIHLRSDGTYFEQSTAYARYTADFYLHLVVLRQRLGDTVPPALLERLERGLEGMLWVTRPDGTTPFFGDDDGGRLLPVDGRPANDMRAALGTAAVLFDRTDFRALAGPLSPETVWLLGPDSVQAYSALKASPPERLSVALEEGGFFVQRDGWDPDADMLVIDCGPLGTLNCGHAHADVLSVDLCVGGRPVVVDSGTFTYSSIPEERNRYRSGAAHNGLTLSGKGSSEPSGPFQWARRSDGELLAWTDLVDGCWFSGRERFAGGAVHERSLLFSAGKGWVVLDDVACAADMHPELGFHLAPDLAAVADPTGLIAITDRVNGVPVAALACLGSPTISLVTVDHSPSYRQRTTTQMIRIRPAAPGPVDFVTLIGRVDAIESLRTEVDRARTLRSSMDAGVSPG